MTSISISPRPAVGQKIVLTEEEILTYPEPVIALYRHDEARRIDIFLKKWPEKQARQKNNNKIFPNDSAIPAEGKTGNNDKIEPKKAAAWQDVCDDLNKIKAKHFNTYLNDLKPEQEVKMDFHIPKEGSWVTFPLFNASNDDTSMPFVDPNHFNGEPVTITWKDYNTVITAKYYKTTCWFGDMGFDPEFVPDTIAAPDGTFRSQGGKAVGGTTTELQPTTSDPVHQKWKASVRLEPFGETELFIAAEFIERRYQGGPHLRFLHLRDRFAPGTKWAYLRIDSMFHYGQDNKAKPKHRYLVYHPFVRTRRIPQRSFAVNNLLNAAIGATESLSGSSNTYLSKAGSSADLVMKSLSILTQDPLRQFKADEKALPIYDISAEIAKREKEWNDPQLALAADLREVQKELMLQQKATIISGKLKESCDSRNKKAAAQANNQAHEVGKEVIAAIYSIDSQMDTIAPEERPLSLYDILFDANEGGESSEYEGPAQHKQEQDRQKPAASKPDEDRTRPGLAASKTAKEMSQLGSGRARKSISDGINEVQRRKDAANSPSQETGSVL